MVVGGGGGEKWAALAGICGAGFVMQKKSAADQFRVGKR